jgi:hypothetical protein
MIGYCYQKCTLRSRRQYFHCISLFTELIRKDEKSRIEKKNIYSASSIYYFCYLSWLKIIILRPWSVCFLFISFYLNNQTHSYPSQIAWSTTCYVLIIINKKYFCFSLSFVRSIYYRTIIIEWYLSVKLIILYFLFNHIQIKQI